MGIHPVTILVFVVVLAAGLLLGVGLLLLCVSLRGDTP